MKSALKLLSASIVALLIASCDSDTGSLGSSVTPAGDGISVESNTYYAASKSIECLDSILSRTSTCYLGKFTDPETGSQIKAEYLTQLNCIDNFLFPDSIYGIEKFSFPDWFKERMEGSLPYRSEIIIYYTNLFGDPETTLQVEVWPLNTILDDNTRFYSDADLTEFYDSSLQPLAKGTISPTDYTETDSARQSSSYYKNVRIALPQEFTKNLLDKYYQDGGKENFSDVMHFIENVCKGFCIRCTAGDGTVIAVDRTDLSVTFNYIERDPYHKKDSLLTRVAGFSGNSEVMQFTTYDIKGNDTMLSDDACTYLKTPYGILTQVTLPIDEIAGSGKSINSASINFTRYNNISTQEYKFGAPSNIVMLRQDSIRAFFDGNAKPNNRTSFVASFEKKYNLYSFNNIALLIARCQDERAEWLEENNLSDDSAGRSAYASAYPNWDKVVLVPVTPLKDANSNVIGYELDITLKSAKLKGGTLGEQVPVKVISSKFNN